MRTKSSNLTQIHAKDKPLLLQQKWARAGLEADASATLESVEKGLTVRLISTARCHFQTVLSIDLLADAIGRPDVVRFDYLPVTETTEKGGQIIGLLHRARYVNVEFAHDQTVQAAMDRLSESNLISSDAGILTFLRIADRQPCCLVVEGTQIAGLVSLSDIQRLPVRPVLFLLITQLELLLGELIRQEFGSDLGWMERLSSGRQSKLRSQLRESEHSDMLIDPILMTQFCDKREIVYRRNNLKNQSDFRSDLEIVEGLRNNLAHANDYAATPDAARSTCEVVRICERWVNNLHDEIAAGRVHGTKTK